VKFWEDRFQQLNHYIQQQKTRIEEESPSELNHTSNNLFVPKKWGEVVSANLEEVKIALQNLQLSSVAALGGHAKMTINFCYRGLISA